MMSYGLPSGTDFVFELVNGNGKDEAGEDKIFDKDKWKNVFFKVNQSFPLFRLGMFGYMGSESIRTEKNDFTMWGPDATVGNDKFELNLQWMRRTDKNPYGIQFAVDPDVETDGIIAEAVIIPNPQKPKWLGVVLYNRVTSDDPFYDYETVTGNISYMLKTNLRIMFESIYDVERENTKLLFGFVTGI